MLGRQKDKYSSKKIQSLAINPKQKPLMRTQTTAEINYEERSINSIDHDIKMFNHKKDNLKSNYKKDYNDKDFDKISQSSYVTRTIREYDSRGYDYEFNKNETGINHYRSGFLKKGYVSPSSKLSNMMSRNDLNQISYKNTVESLEIQNSKLHYEKNHLQGRINKYLEKISIIETHSLQVEEQLDDMRMSYQRLMHQYRQLSLIHEDSIEKQRGLCSKVDLLTDKNFKLQQMLYSKGQTTESERQNCIEEDDEVQKILHKTQVSIDQYVVELDSLRQLINEKQQSEINLQRRIQNLEFQLQFKSQNNNNDRSQQQENEIQRLNTIIETQRQLEQALEEKIQRLSTSIICQKCGTNVVIEQSKLNIPTSTSLNI